jgi:hypothetical protein
MTHKIELGAFEKCQFKVWNKITYDSLTISEVTFTVVSVSSKDDTRFTFYDTISFQNSRYLINPTLVDHSKPMIIEITNGGNTKKTYEFFAEMQSVKSCMEMRPQSCSKCMQVAGNLWTRNGVCHKGPVNSIYGFENAATNIYECPMTKTCEGIILDNSTKNNTSKLYKMAAGSSCAVAFTNKVNKNFAISLVKKVDNVVFIEPPTNMKFAADYVKHHAHGTLHDHFGTNPVTIKANSTVWYLLFNPTSTEQVYTFKF